MKNEKKMAFNRTDTVFIQSCHPEIQHCHPEFISGSAQPVKCEQTLKQVQGDTISVQHDIVENFQSVKKPVTAPTPPPPEAAKPC